MNNKPIKKRSRQQLTVERANGSRDDYESAAGERDRSKMEVSL